MSKYLLRRTKVLLVAVALVVSLFAQVAFAQSAEAPGDYDGDGKSDYATAVVDRSGWKTTFYINHNNTSVSEHVINAPGDAIVPGDYNGDRKTQPALVWVVPQTAELAWYIRQPNGSTSITIWGVNRDQPIVGDFDCDGKDDLTTVRTIGLYKYWQFKLSSGRTKTNHLFGLAEDQIYAADINGDSCDELVVSRVSGVGIDWYYQSMNSSLTNYRYVQWGLRGDTTLTPADMDGNGKADFLVVRDMGGTKVLYKRTSSTGYPSESFGVTNDIPLIGRFSGVLRNEFAVFRRGSNGAADFFVKNANGGTTKVSFANNASILLRPDSTVVQPNAGSGGGGVGQCRVTHSSGWLLKPASQDSGGSRQGKPLILYTRNLPSSSCLNVLATNGQVVAKYGKFSSTRYYSGYGCGSNLFGSQIAQRAVAASGSKHIFLHDPATNVCWGSGPADGRTDRR